MNDKTKINLESYDRAAAKLAAVYNGMASESVLPGFAERLPVPSPGKILRALDLGCGSGRDAHWLAERGFEVVAVDGAAEMIAQARDKKSHPRVTYMQDFMPGIDNVRALGRTFDVVLMSAVWMHLDGGERETMMDNIRALTNDNAIIYVSLRHGESPADRPMFDTSAREMEQLAAERGMTFEFLGGDDDKQGRSGKVYWEYVALRR